MRGPPFKDIEVSKLSDEVKARFQLALKGQLDIVTCRDCPQSRGFVQVVEYLLPFMIEAAEKMDRASQTMEEFIKVFNQLEEREMKARMLGDEGL